MVFMTIDSCNNTVLDFILNNQIAELDKGPEDEYETKLHPDWTK